MVVGKFVLLDAATLAQMKTDWTAALQAIAVGNQSYSIAGRTFTRAQLSEVSDMVAEIAYAQAFQSGAVQRTVYSDMSMSAENLEMMEFLVCKNFARIMRCAQQDRDRIHEFTCGSRLSCMTRW
jgi:hypothetical protein